MINQSRRKTHERLIKSLGKIKNHLNAPLEEDKYFIRSWVDPKDPENIITFTRKPKTKRLKQEGVFYKVPRKRDLPKSNERRKGIILLLKKRTDLQTFISIPGNVVKTKIDTGTYNAMKYAYKRYLKKIGRYKDDLQLDRLIVERLSTSSKRNHKYNNSELSDKESVKTFLKRAA